LNGLSLRERAPDTSKESKKSFQNSHLEAFIQSRQYIDTRLKDLSNCFNDHFPFSPRQLHRICLPSTVRGMLLTPINDGSIKAGIRSAQYMGK